MESVNQILEKNSEVKESDFKKCEKCGEPLQKRIQPEGFKSYVVPVNCSCKNAESKSKEVDEANAEKQIRLKRIIKNSLMDEKFRSCTFEAWDFNKGSKKMYNMGKKYSEDFKKMKDKSIGLLIYGEPGNGKTHTVSCIANALLNNGVPAICVNISGLLNRIQETYKNHGKEGEADILRGLANADLLIIDDLGTESISDWSVSKVYNIIDNRYRNGLPLIITTNLKLAELKETYHERTYDRLLEMCTPVINDGKSLRVDKGKEKTAILKELFS